MKKLLVIALILFGAAWLHGQTRQGPFVGVITETMCGADHAMMKIKPESKCVVECVRSNPDQHKYALQSGSQQYVLSDQQTPEKFAAQKVKDIARGGAGAPAIDNVRVEPAEYPKYLARAYKEEKFPKPRNILGMARDLPVPEMEKLMLTHILVTNDDLRLLAVARASGVRDRLLLSEKVEPERIFLVEPSVLAPERKEKLKDSRVDFRLR